METLVSNKPYTAGNHTVKWNAADLGTGVYFYKVSIDGSSLTKKMLLMK